MRRLSCPRCRAETVWQDNPWRPFCSERCRMIDLGAWLDGEYVIPGPPSELADDPADGEPGDRSPAPPEGGLPAGASGAKGRDSRR